MLKLSKATEEMKKFTKSHFLYQMAVKVQSKTTLVCIYCIDDLRVSDPQASSNIQSPGGGAVQVKWI